MTTRPSGGEVPRATRAFVVGFLAVFTACGLAGVEAWPFTGWRLFSRLRGPVQVGWQAVTVDPAGAERALPFDRLPRGFGDGLHLMPRLGSAPPGERRAVCRAWAAAVEGLDGGVVEAVRVYRTAFSVRDGAERWRRLEAECARGPGW